MELILKRTYYPDGTNGELYYGDHLLGYIIELPWLQNQRNISCIPEGTYPLAKRETEKRGKHIIVLNVPGRSGILIHPANDALKELKGCLAPVSRLTGPGKGLESRYATFQVERLVFEALNVKEEVFITIKKKEIMNIIERVKAPVPKFFKKIRTIGLALVAAGGAIAASPIALPASILAIGGYLIVGGGVLTAVSQITVDEGNQETSKNE